MPVTGDVFHLDKDQAPTHWYNVLADLPFEVPAPRPPLARDTGADEARAPRPQLPPSLYRQSTGSGRFVEIPEPVRSEYQRRRPTPLYRATGLERALDTPAHIYFKFEGTSPSGSHKINTALPQAYYYSRSGVREMVTGTGAGQWGTALATACHPYGMECTVFRMRCSYEQKPYRGTLMRLNGAQVVKSPSTLTEAGRAALWENPRRTGQPRDRQCRGHRVRRPPVRRALLHRQQGRGNRPGAGVRARGRPRDGRVRRSPSATAQARHPLQYERSWSVGPGGLRTVSLR
ncbi:pyridoxal-phosphate dependent enzyme [Streptomyces viridosporus]|uniref:pyridoxal-phosphate dependent enzyme n=1 Tax=Streptomyces viridosporus TaxID=67581 RepID=UPI0021002C24|nr:pyridoxal-phosphate dependent enzyme [Streptomyces viridosporus]